MSLGILSTSDLLIVIFPCIPENAKLSLVTAGFRSDFLVAKEVN